jgi:hypothetical protein
MKKVFVLLALIVLIAVVTISVFIIMQGGKGLSSFSSKPTPTTVQQTALLITPQAITVQPNQITTAQVMIQNSKSAPAIVQLELAYDPIALTNVTIVPGNFFSQPNILFSRINQSAGRISYVLQPNSTTTQLNTTAPVAIISFVSSGYATSAQTQMSFLPKSVVKDKDNNNILNGMYGTRITFATGGFNTIPTPTTAPVNLPLQPTMTPPNEPTISVTTTL